MRAAAPTRTPSATRSASRGYVEKGPVVERILIHLERQRSPADFRAYGARVVPFYNYLQAAFVLHEDGRLPAARRAPRAQSSSSSRTASTATRSRGATSTSRGAGTSRGTACASS